MVDSPTITVLTRSTLNRSDSLIIDLWSIVGVIGARRPAVGCYITYTDYTNSTGICTVNALDCSAEDVAAAMLKAGRETWTEPYTRKPAVDQSLNGFVLGEPAGLPDKAPADWIGYVRPFCFLGVHKAEPGADHAAIRIEASDEWRRLEFLSEPLIAPVAYWQALGEWQSAQFVSPFTEPGQ